MRLWREFGGLLTAYPQDTLHEMFEYFICLISETSCYAQGEGGSTIYNSSPTEEECLLNPTDPECDRGPTDAAICQVTPEACSGTNSAN